MMVQDPRKYRLENLVIELVQNFVKNNFKTPPFYKEVLEKTGLEIINKPLPFSQDGYLLGNQIILNSNIDYKPRWVFTIFHEITHHLILKDGEVLEYLNDFYRGEGENIKFKNHLEFLTNLGAAEFLIPTEELQKAIQRNGFSIDSFKSLRVNFESSTPAFLIKFAYLSPVDCICLSCAQGIIKPDNNLLQEPLFTTEKKAINDLFIEYWAKSPNFLYSLRRFSVIPRDHLIRRCFESGTPLADDSYFPFASGKKMPCFAEVFGEKGRIYGILYKEKPISQESQITLGL